MPFPSTFSTKLNTESSIKIGIIGTFAFVGLLLVTVAGITFAMTYGRYNAELAKYVGAQKDTTTTQNVFVSTSQVAMDTMKQISSYFWTSDEVSKYAEKLAMYKPETLTLGQVSETTVTYSDGTVGKMLTRTIQFGAVMSLKEFETMYRSLETNRKFVSISSVNVDALKSYKELTLTFYISPTFPEPSTYPVKLADLYEFVSGTSERSPNTIPVLVGNHLVWGSFSKVQESILPTGLTPKAAQIIVIRP